MNPLLASVVALSLGVASLVGADTPAKPKAKAESPKAPARFVNNGDPERLKSPLLIKPDENIAYGPHRMQKLYFWRAKSDQPTQLALRVNIKPQCKFRLSDKPRCQRIRWLRKVLRSSGTSVQQTGSGTNSIL